MMSSSLILRIALPTPLRRLFDYLPPQVVDQKQLIPGIRVRVPFQSRTLIGILTAVVSESSVPYEKLKSAVELLDTEALFPPDIYELCQWSAAYYHYSLGEVLSHALPLLLRKGKAAKLSYKKIIPAKIIEETPLLNAAQQSAVAAICAAKNSFQTFLLDGVTGSGKTEVYLRAITEILKLDKQVLLLVPEISLTPQTLQRLSARYAVPIAALHSGLSEKERLQAWLGASTGDIKIVIGTRSAIFTPFKKLGLIIVDEEHDTSFKQQDRFRYHARDLAILRANLNTIPIILGSATPSLESVLNVQRGRYQHLLLPQRAGGAKEPNYQLIDIKQKTLEAGLSAILLQSMRAHLDAGNQVMLFLNRRGFAPVLYCTQCTWTAHCQRCDARLVYHRSPLRLQCHHCDARYPIPKHCMQCQQTELIPIGLGTQRLEMTLEKFFPEVPIIRIDRDNTSRKGSMQDLLQQIHAQQKAILLGTQMLAKGHHFPHVTLVGIIDADSGLFSVDFRAAEQMGQLLLQVAGRAGRAEKPGTVLIQTRHPQHALLQTLIYQGYQTFSQTLLAEREKTLLPPYVYFAVFRAESYAAEKANDFLTAIKALCPLTEETVTMLGPVPALLNKRKGLHCQHLLVKAHRRGLLQHFLKDMLGKIEALASQYAVKWVLDVDPVEI
ncbi:MAG: primosomal protein N' [Gammaproteobacteria bacterium]|nr:primosomal protein N' [Gammaproteobacteria bacterium]